MAEPKAQTISLERLRGVLNYNPLTGFFTWKVATNPSIMVGAVAGSKSRQGYIKIKIDRKIYMAHRLAWFYATEKWPRLLIDHKNRNKADNRIENLREASNSDNKCSAIVRRSGKYRGVYLYRPTGRWQARITKNNTIYNLGLFDTQEEAYTAYCTAAVRLHGEFAEVA